MRSYEWTPRVREFEALLILVRKEDQIVLAYGPNHASLEKTGRAIGEPYEILPNPHPSKFASSRGYFLGGDITPLSDV